MNLATQAEGRMAKDTWTYKQQ